MSIETANAARFKKGMMKLTPLEGELLEALEALMDNYRRVDGLGFESLVVGSVVAAITHAHGDSPDCEAS